MAHIFKYPTNNSKGILVFSHKEINFFIKPEINIRKTVLQSNFQTLSFSEDILDLFIAEQLAILRKHFFIGVHFGWYHANQPTFDFIDFYMAGPGTVNFLPGTTPFLIPLCSRNFISDFYENRHYADKYWDIICVAGIQKNKKMDELFNAVRKIYDSGKLYNVLLVVPSRPNESLPKYHTNLISRYSDEFNHEERKHFCFLKLAPELTFMGISQYQLVHFYNSSKVFTVFSQEEGECRVISEALICGLPVVVKDDLRGGGRDYLDETNSFLFSDYNDAHTTLMTAVENYQTKIPDAAIIKKLRCDYTIEPLEDYFAKLYAVHHQHYERGHLLNLDHLDMRLPGHWRDVAWSVGPNADIVTQEQLMVFVNEIKSHLT